MFWAKHHRLWSSLFMELSDFAVTCPLKFPNPFEIRWKWSIWVWNSNSHIYITVSPKSHTVFMKLNWMMLTYIWYSFSVKTGKYLLVLATPILVFFIPFADCKPNKMSVVLNKLCLTSTKFQIRFFTAVLSLSHWSFLQ